MNITIRLAVASDANIIVDFNDSMAKETENLELDRERLRKGVDALIGDSTKGKYFLAEVESKVVGQLMVTYEWSDWRNATFWWIQSVYVLPEYRNQSVFRTLYQFVDSLARVRDDVCGLRLYVEKENYVAWKIYKNLGMKNSHYQMMNVDFVIK